MEQTDVHKSVTAQIKQLKEQLAICEQSNIDCEQSGKDASKEIEDHFAQCLNALAARKAILLHEVAQKVSSQKQKVEESKAKLESSIEVCKNTLKSAEILFNVDKNSAEGILKALTTMNTPRIGSLKITAKLPTTLHDVIQSHGEVVDSSHFSQPVGDSRRFSQPDNVSTFAGSTRGNVDGRGINAKFNSPWGICFHLQDECFYFCDRGNNLIKKVTLQGDVTTFAAGNHLSEPIGIVSSNKENTFFVTNYTGHTISKITSSGTISCFAGSGQKGSADGVGTNASFNGPCGIAIDQQSGNLFVSDYYNHKIRKITPTGIVSTLAGSDYGFADGNGNSAKFNGPSGICFDADSGSLIVCDNANNKLRCVNLNGDVSTVCDISYPEFVVITVNNTILVSSQTHCVYKVTYQGSQKYKTEVIAGGINQKGKQDGKPSESLFYLPTGIVVHEPSHSLFVCEHYNHDIRRVSFVNI